MTAEKISEAKLKVCEIFTRLSTITAYDRPPTNTSDEIMAWVKSNIFMLKWFS